MKTYYRIRLIDENQTFVSDHRTIHFPCFH
jgi:hypothetical protein